MHELFQNEDVAVQKYCGACVIIALCLSIIRFAIREVSPSQKDGQCKDKLILTMDKTWPILIAFMFVVLLMHWFNLWPFKLFVVVSIFGSIFAPYMSSRSRFADKVVSQIELRPWDDRLVVSSGSYAVSSILALFYSQYNMAWVCLVTSMGSTFYHRHRESKYFNFDMIFATSLLVHFSYTLWHSFRHNEVYFQVGLFGIFVAGFLFVYCGQPSDITVDKLDFCCIRSDRPIYNVFHCYWHLASGLGPVLSILYIDSLRTEGIQTDCVPYLCEYGLMLGVFLNIIGNISGHLPVD